jgi:hypothetical protein
VIAANAKPSFQRPLGRCRLVPLETGNSSLCFNLRSSSESISTMPVSYAFDVTTPAIWCCFGDDKAFTFAVSSGDDLTFFVPDRTSTGHEMAAYG